MADLQFRPDMMPAVHRAISGVADRQAARHHALPVTKPHVHIIAHHPIALSILQVRIPFRRGHHRLEQITFTAVVMARVIHIHHALSFHIRLAGQDKHMHSIGRHGRGGLASNEDSSAHSHNAKRNSHGWNLTTEAQRTQRKIPLRSLNLCGEKKT